MTSLISTEAAYVPNIMQSLVSLLAENCTLLSTWIGRLIVLVLVLPFLPFQCIFSTKLLSNASILRKSVRDLIKDAKLIEKIERIRPKSIRI